MKLFKLAGGAVVQMHPARDAERIEKLGAVEVEVKKNESMSDAARRAYEGTQIAQKITVRRERPESLVEQLERRIAELEKAQAADGSVKVEK